jgi:hypothetical protein
MNKTLSDAYIRIVVAILTKFERFSLIFEASQAEVTIAGLERVRWKIFR